MAGKVMTMSAFRKTTLTSLLLAGALLATPAAASTTFDGQWSVQIASSNSTCTNGASVSIGISNGQVASNTASVSASGRVGASGRVAEAGIINVTLSSGIKRAVGFGRLSGSSGSGTWRAALCS